MSYSVRHESNSINSDTEAEYIEDLKRWGWEWLRNLYNKYGGSEKAHLRAMIDRVPGMLEDLYILKMVQNLDNIDIENIMNQPTALPEGFDNQTSQSRVDEGALVGMGAFARSTPNATLNCPPTISITEPDHCQKNQHNQIPSAIKTDYLSLQRYLTNSQREHSSHGSTSPSGRQPSSSRVAKPMARAASIQASSSSKRPTSSRTNLSPSAQSPKRLRCEIRAPSGTQSKSKDYKIDSRQSPSAPVERAQRVICSKCGKDVGRVNRDKIQHEKSCGGPGAYECPIEGCSCRFKGDFSLTRHLIDHHNMGIPCKFCEPPKQFLQNRLDRHISETHKSLNCLKANCNAKFSRLIERARHLARDHDEGNFECCSTKFATVADIEHHYVKGDCRSNRGIRCCKNERCMKRFHTDKRHELHSCGIGPRKDKERASGATASPASTMQSFYNSPAGSEYLTEEHNDHSMELGKEVEEYGSQEREENRHD